MKPSPLSSVDLSGRNPMRYYFTLLCCLIGLINPFVTADLQPCCLDLPDNGDYTGDGSWDIDDLAELAERWLTCCNQQDLKIMSENWLSQTHYFYEAESAAQQTRFSPFTVQNDSSASGEQYIVVPNGVGSNSVAPENTGIIDFAFESELPVAVWLRVYTPTLNDDSFWMRADGGTWTEWNSIGATDAWTWKRWGYIGGTQPALIFRYANGSTGDRPCDVYLNSQNKGKLDFPRTGSWTSWQTVRIYTEMLSGAVNTIRVTANSAAGGPNLDSMTVSGKTGNQVYQAEGGTRGSGSTVSSENEGYTGTGYVDYGGSGSWCQFASIVGQEGGETSHTLSIGWREDGSRLDKICITSDLAFQPQRKEGYAALNKDLNIPATAAIINSGRLGVWVDPSGAYGLYTDCPLWIFEGNLGQAITPSLTAGSDILGNYNKISFTYGSGKYRGSLRLYQNRPVVICETTCLTSVTDRLFGSFPTFTSYPSYLYAHGYKGIWGGIRFARDQIGTDSPAVFYDKHGFACIVSPASNFMDAWTSYGDTLQCGLQSYATSIPKDYTHSVMLVFDQGINQTFDTWGQALTDLQGKVRPAYDADKGLKYLGYWTDNGAAYYYKYDESIGSYEGTLLAVKQSYDNLNIRLGYMQLDSWWYQKMPPDNTDPFAWEGLWLYEPIDVFFPNGLADFYRRLGLPFITHNRWVRTDSPYRSQYTFSGGVSIDPAFWDKIIGDIASWGVETYEQDWLDAKALPQNILGHGDLYADNMARACAENGLTMQYCMETPRFYLQASKYSHLTTLRVSDDRFSESKWSQFFYASRLVRSVGAWPWVDVFRSTETGNTLLSILSAGMVGMADGINQQSTSNILALCRHDGVLVKPDVPIVPSDSTYIRRAQGDTSITGFTYTDFPAYRVAYVFDLLSGQTGFRPEEFGLSGNVYIYDYFAGSGVVRAATETFNKNESNWSYYVLAPAGPSGIAFLGDRNMFVSCGKNRISSITNTSNSVNAAVLFAPHDGPARLHGYSPVPVTVTPGSGAQMSDYSYRAADGYFSFNLYPTPAPTSVVEVSVTIVPQ